MKKVKEAKEKGGEPPYHFIEVMACPGGCVGGGGQIRGVTDKVRQERAEGLVADDRGRTLRRSHQNKEVMQMYKDLGCKPMEKEAHHLFHTSYTPRKQYKR